MQASTMHGCAGTRKLTLSSPLYSFCSRVTQPFCAEAMLLLLSACGECGGPSGSSQLLDCCSGGWDDVRCTQKGLGVSAQEQKSSTRPG
jgi:hypothetical protein